MGLHLNLAVFIWSYFLLEIKIVKTDHNFLLLCSCQISSYSCVFSGVFFPQKKKPASAFFIRLKHTRLTTLAFAEAFLFFFLNYPTLLSSPSLCDVKPQNPISTSNTWTPSKPCLDATLKISQSLCSDSLSSGNHRERTMWAYAFLNKPETLSPEMELWLCGRADWVVGGRRTYVYCKLRQILSAKYKSRSETKKIQLKASRAAVSGQYGLKSLVIEGLPVN